MITDNFRLDGKVAVVTGSGKGIGQAIGLAFSQAGANVVFSARTQKDCEANVEEAKKLEGRALAVCCDVTQDDQLQNLADKTLDAFGKIDIIINNAGGAWPSPIPGVKRQQFNEAFDFNVTSAFSFTKICLPYLKQSQGCVINISSSAGRLVQPNFAVYGTVKSALVFLTKLMAAELAPDVRVNAIAPGSILTDSLSLFLDQNMRDKMANLTPMKRIGDVKDIALAAVYLASPAAGWVTGKLLEVDGGSEVTNMPF